MSLHITKIEEVPNPPRSPLSPLYIDPNEINSNDSENIIDGTSFSGTKDANADTLDPLATLNLYARRKAKIIRNQDLAKENTSLRSIPTISVSYSDNTCNKNRNDDEEHVYVTFEAESKRDNNLEKEPWWKPTQKKKELENSLRGRATGAFFIRQSTTRQGDFVLMVNAGSLGIQKMLIIKDRDSSKYRLCAQAARLSGSKNQKFQAITDLVRHYTKFPLLKQKNVFLMPDAPFCDWFRPDACRKTTESELMESDAGEFVVRNSVTKSHHFSLDVSAGKGNRPYRFLIHKKKSGLKTVRWGDRKTLYSTIFDLVYHYTLHEIGKTGITLKKGPWSQRIGFLSKSDGEPSNATDETMEHRSDSELSGGNPATNRCITEEFCSSESNAYNGHYAELWKDFNE